MTTNIYKLFRSFIDNYNASNPQSLFSASVEIETSTDPPNLSIIDSRYTEDEVMALESAMATAALLVEKALLDWRPSFCLSSCGSKM